MNRLIQTLSRLVSIAGARYFRFCSVDVERRYFYFVTRWSRGAAVVVRSVFFYPLRRVSGRMRAATRLNAGVLIGAAVALVATSLPVVVGSNAAWSRSQWDNAAVGTLNCADPGVFKTRGAGKLLGGSLLPVDLDDVATVEGVRVTNDGATATPQPAGTQGTDADEFTNPLNVSALNLVNLPLTGTSLAALLQINTNNDVGVVNQYGKAKSTGYSQGASGVVNNSGSIMTDNAPSGGTPKLGTLKLSTLVESLTGEAVSDVVSGVTDLSLEFGAVAGRATLDGCAETWVPTLADHLKRTYAIAGLDANIDSPAVAGLSSTLTTQVTAVQSLLNGIASDGGVLPGITTGLSTLLTGVLGTLSLGSVSIEALTVTADLSAVNALATAQISDTNNTVLLDLGTGKVSVDLASLLGSAYGGEGFSGSGPGLNGLDPNTELVINAPVTNALTAALTNALDQWVADVVDTLGLALNAAQVHAVIKVALGGTVYPIIGSPQTLTVANVNITVDGTLAGLLANTATVNASVTILDNVPIIGTLINLLVSPLVGGIVTAVTSGVAPMLGGVLQGVIFADGGVVKSLGTTLSNATAPVITLLANVLVGYLGVDGLVSLKANLQNDALTGSGTYPDWESGSQNIPADRYDVAALGVGVLNAVGPGTNINLELGRASVGVNCMVGGAWDAGGRCAGY